MRHRVNWEALGFCLLWALLAAVGFALEGLRAGLLLSIGLFPLIMLASMLILSRTGDFRLERAVRWGILGAAALMLASFADLAG